MKKTIRNNGPFRPIEARRVSPSNDVYLIQEGDHIEISCDNIDELIAVLAEMKTVPDVSMKLAPVSPVHQKGGWKKARGVFDGLLGKIGDSDHD